MSDPVRPAGSYGNSFANVTDAQMTPNIRPFPADNPWVKGLIKLFPHASISDLQKMAPKFQENMFSALSREIQREVKKSKETARKNKAMLEGKE